MTGFALLVVQFYFDADAWLIDPGVMALEPWQAIAISVASLAAGWLVYDGLCRSPLGRNIPALSGVVYVFVVAASWGYTEVFSGRSALVHAGALIGTVMAFNVFAVIIPNQKKVTAALLAGETPDPRFGEVGKQRSVHNTYLTLPVLVLMVSGHYPMLTGHPHAWLLVALIIAGGGCARHFLVHHEVGTAFRSIAWTLPVMGVALAAAIWLTAPRRPRPEPRPGRGGERHGGAGDHPDPLRLVPLRAAHPTPPFRSRRRTWCSPPPTTFADTPRSSTFRRCRTGSCPSAT